MDASATTIRAENLTLTQQNLGLRQQITSLRNDRLELQYKLVEAIGAKESFKIEVIKLINQTQNTFERLKTFIEHTTSTPPPSLLTGTEKSLRRQIVGDSQKQQRPHGILRQIPFLKDTQQIPAAQGAQGAPPPPMPSSTSVKNDNDDMHFIDEKIRKLNTILKKYKYDVEKDIKKEEQEVRKTTATVPSQVAAKQATNVQPDNQNRRYSKRLHSLASGPAQKQLSTHEAEDNKENLGQTCGFKDITNGAQLRLGETQHKKRLGEGGEGKLDSPAPKVRGRKRKTLLLL